jgi:hypothetical protein
MCTVIYDEPIPEILPWVVDDIAIATTTVASTNTMLWNLSMCWGRLG